MTRKLDDQGSNPGSQAECFDAAKYPLPDFLVGRCEASKFYYWLNAKANTMLRRDRKRGKAFAWEASKATYKGKIYDAIRKCGERDPFTGELLDWDLIGKWDSSTERVMEKFALMPTVDHIDPDVLEFEICSWLVNDSKSYMTPAEFVAFCRKVVKRAGRAKRRK
jgi:hypothetical protein